MITEISVVIFQNTERMYDHRDIGSNISEYTEDILYTEISSENTHYTEDAR